MIYLGLMSLVHNGPEDIGYILNDSAEVLIEYIETQDEPPLELLNFIRYAGSTDLTEYNRQCSGLWELSGKYKQIVKAIEEKANNNDSFKSLLNKLFESKTHFNEHLDKSEFISSSLTI